MITQFAAKRIANLKDDLDPHRVIIFSIFELMHRVVMVNRAGGKMDQIARVLAKQAGAEQTPAFRVRAQLTKSEVVARARRSLPTLRLSAEAGTTLCPPFQGKRIRDQETQLEYVSASSICDRHRL
jgi:hypothetical protein